MVFDTFPRPPPPAPPNAQNRYVTDQNKNALAKWFLFKTMRQIDAVLDRCTANCLRNPIQYKSHMLWSEAAYHMSCEAGVDNVPRDEQKKHSRYKITHYPMNAGTVAIPDIKIPRQLQDFVSTIRKHC